MLYLIFNYTNLINNYKKLLLLYFKNFKLFYINYIFVDQGFSYFIILYLRIKVLNIRK